MNKRDIIKENMKSIADFIHNAIGRDKDYKPYTSSFNVKIISPEAEIIPQEEAETVRDKIETVVSKLGAHE